MIVDPKKSSSIIRGREFGCSVECGDCVYDSHLEILHAGRIVLPEFVYYFKAHLVFGAIKRETYYLRCYTGVLTQRGVLRYVAAGWESSEESQISVE